MNLSAHSAARRDNISRQSGELPSQSFTLPTYLDPMNPLLLTGRVPAQYALFESIRHQRYRQALLLVEAGVLIDSRNDRGETPLICTSIFVEDPKVRVRFAQLFLEAGADLNAQDWKGLTVLTHSAILGQIDIVLLLVEQPNLELDIQDQEGNTALMHAAKNGYEKITAILINAYWRQEKLMELDHKNVEGLTALDLASSNHHLACMNLLRLASESPDQLLNVTLPVVPAINLNSNLSAKEEDEEEGLESSIDELNSDETGVEIKRGSSGSTNIRELPSISRQTNTSTQPNNGLTSLQQYCEDISVVRDENGSKIKKIKSPVPRISILPLLSLSNIDTTSNEPWEWDMGATGRRIKQSNRVSDTGSRSLTESRGRILDSSELLIDNRFSNSMGHLNTSSSGAPGKDPLGSSSKHHSSFEINILPPLMPNKEGLHLPPIRASVSDYKRALRTPPKDVNTSKKGE